MSGFLKFDFGGMPLKSQVALFYPTAELFVLLQNKNTTWTLNTMFKENCAIISLLKDEKYYKNILASQMSGFLKLDFGT